MNATVELLAEWKQRLCLHDWRIHLNPYCKPCELTLDNVAGEAHIDEVNKCAAINVLSEKYWRSRIVPYDFEKILVHELLHLKFNLIQAVDNDLQERYVHQLLDDIARALIDAKRTSGNDDMK